MLENAQKLRSTIIGILTAIVGIVAVFKPDVFTAAEIPALIEWIGSGVLVISGILNVIKTKW
jgi:drug/metabolite transporter (DMT)-like permease